MNFMCAKQLPRHRKRTDIIFDLDTIAIYHPSIFTGKCGTEHNMSKYVLKKTKRQMESKMYLQI